MSDDRDPDAAQDSARAREQEQDRQIGAKMRLFLDRMITAAREEEGIDEERAIDILLCAAIQLYIESRPITPRDLSLFCKAIAEELSASEDAANTLH